MTSLKLPELKAKLALIKSTSPNVVDLSNDDLSNDSVVNSLALWLDTHRPRDIILRNCDITDKTMHMIACFCRSNDNLRLLSLRDNKIGEKGCSILSELCFTNKFIESIDLFGNPLLESPSANIMDIGGLIEVFEGSSHLKSLCGCTAQAPELTLYKPLNDEYEGSFIAADLRKGIYMKSLQIQGASAFSQIVDALQVNSTLLRLKVTDFRMSRVGLAALKSTLAANSTLKTLQLSFRDLDEKHDGGYVDLLCGLFESIGCNSSISTVQIDNMPFNFEVIGAIGKMIQQNHSIVHLSLFNMYFNADQLRSLLFTLEGNNSIRLLHLSEGCEVSSELHSSMESVAETRMYPLTFRVGESDFKYGQGISKASNDDFEVEDVVEAFHDGDGWCPATVLVVLKDYKYCVRFHTGQIKVNYRGQLLRRGDNFYRHHSIPVPAAVSPVTSGAGTAAVEEAAQQQQPETSSSAISTSEISPLVSEQYPYRVGQEVEVRFMGDLLWYSGRVTKASFPSLVDVAIIEDESIRAGMTEEQAFQHDLQLVQMEYPLYLVRDVYPPKDSEGTYYDVGFYQRGDYVEVYRRHFGGWRRGRLAVDRKNGTYDIRFEDHEEQRVRGRYMRHHFKANSVADCRLIGTTEWSKNVIVVGQDKSSGMYLVRYTEGTRAGTEERTVHPRRLMPCERSQFRAWAEQYHAENNAPARVTGRTAAVAVQLLAEATVAATVPAPVQYEAEPPPAPATLKVETGLSLTSSTEDINSSPVVENSSPVITQPFAAEDSPSNNENVAINSTPDVTLAFQETKKAPSNEESIIVPTSVEVTAAPAVSTGGSAFVSETGNRRASKAQVSKTAVSSSVNGTSEGIRRPSVKNANTSSAVGQAVPSLNEERRPSTKPTVLSEDIRRGSVRPAAPASSGVSSVDESRRTSLRPTGDAATAAANVAAGGGDPLLSSSVSPVLDYYKGVAVGERVEVYEPISRRYTLRTIHQVNPNGTFDVVDEFGDITYGLDDSQLKPKIGGSGKSAAFIAASPPIAPLFSQSMPAGQLNQLNSKNDVGAGADKSVAPVKYKVGARIEALVDKDNSGEPDWWPGVVAQSKGNNQYVVILDDEESDRLMSLNDIRPANKVVENSLDYADDLSAMRAMLASAIKPPQQQLPVTAPQPTAPAAALSSHTQSSPIRNRLAQPSQNQEAVTKTPLVSAGPVTRTPVTYSSSTAQAIMSANSHNTTASTLTAGSLPGNNNESLLSSAGAGLLRTPVSAPTAPAAVAGGSSHHSHHHHHHHHGHNQFHASAQGHTHHSPVTVGGGGAPVLPLLQSKPPSGEDAVGEFEGKLSSQLGIKDLEKCAAVAQCLVQQGCSSWSEMMDLGGLFDTGDDKADIDGLRKFLQEAGVPLFIAAKLAAYIKKS